MDSKDGLRRAIGKVVDATLAVKAPHIWGETATWCASNSLFCAIVSLSALTISSSCFVSLSSEYESCLTLSVS